MIWKDLDKSLIFTQIEAQSWEEVLEITGTAMVKKGYAKESYVRALIEREIKYPTGIDMGEIKVAIPHTDTSEIKRKGIAIATLKNPVAFGQMGAEKSSIMVELVLVLAIKESGSQVDYLKRIMSLIQDQEVLNQLKNAGTSQSVIDIIRQKEESL